MKVTAETITIDLLQVLRRAVRKEIDELSDLHFEISALLDEERIEQNHPGWMAVRERVAAAWNARHGDER